MSAPQIRWLAALALSLALCGSSVAQTKVDPFKLLQDERPTMFNVGMLRLNLVLRDFAVELNRIGPGVVEMRAFYRKEQSRIVLQVFAGGIPATRDNCRDLVNLMRVRAEVDPRDGVRTSFRFASIYARQFIEPGARELDHAETLFALDETFVVFVQITDTSKTGPGSRIVCDGPLQSSAIDFRD